jgi:hypothetical protein
MAETITIEAPGLSGETGLTLYLYSQADNTLLNTDGDALAEVASSDGVFTATLTETRATNTVYRLVVRDAVGPVWYDWLDAGQTRNREALLSVASIETLLQTGVAGRQEVRGV